MGRRVGWREETEIRLIKKMNCLRGWSDFQNTGKEREDGGGARKERGSERGGEDEKGEKGVRI